MINGAPQFVFRLDFWGDTIDLLGLTILLSCDVQVLRPLLSMLTRLPNIQRRTELTSRLHQKNVTFIQSFLPALQPARLQTLNGVEVADFLKIFPDWRRSQAIPESIDVCAVNFDHFLQRSAPWIYAAQATTEEPLPNQKPLAGPLPSTDLFSRAEKQSQNTIYTAGFLLMACGSILSLIQIAIGHS